MNEKTLAVSEQRRHPREALGIKFDMRLAGEEAVSCRAVITDLSQGGMTLQSNAVLERGMTLLLTLPSDIKIRGEVRHVGAAVAGRRRYGVRFHKVGYTPFH